MQSNGFPVLPGLILNGWAIETETAVSKFCQARNYSELLLRIEKPGQRWTRRRGGYNIPISAVRSVVQDLAKEGMLALLLEPASPYSDLYSLTSVSDLDTGKVDIEVVGSGFDASDILRADFLPHERFEAHFAPRKEGDLPTNGFQIKRVHVVGRGDYHASVHRRLEKIGAKLRNPAFPDELMGESVSRPERERLAREATDFLRVSGQTTLLSHAEEYQPITTGLLNSYLELCMRLSEKIRLPTVHPRILSMAASFLPNDRLVFWDFFAPGESDTSILLKI